MFCSKCGTSNGDNAYRCVQCSEILHPTTGSAPVYTIEEPLAALIPYKNSSALVAYYLAVFSLIPFLGIFLGIPAFFLGLRGLRYAREHPEAKGQAHAWIGIIGGGFFGFGYLILTLFLMSYIFIKH